jgi:hypothetical protein
MGLEGPRFGKLSEKRLYLLLESSDLLEVGSSQAARGARCIGVPVWIRTILTVRRVVLARAILHKGTADVLAGHESDFLICMRSRDSSLALNVRIVGNGQTSLNSQSRGGNGENQRFAVEDIKKDGKRDDIPLEGNKCVAHCCHSGGEFVELLDMVSSSC